MDAAVWDHFHRHGKGQELAIGFVDSTYFGLPDSFAHRIYIHHDVVAKAIAKHELTPAHFEVIDDALLRGAIITDPRRAHHLNFVHFNQYPHNYWFLLAIKKCARTPHIYVTTFYNIRERDLLRKVKKSTLLRGQIETGA